jgi:hypothetical protein
MLRKSRLFSFVSSVLILFLASLQVWASCPGIYQHPPCAEFWRADAVFTATATKVEYKQTNPDFAYESKPKIVTLTIEERFRGIEEKEVVLDLNDCGFDFKQGEKYLVYARRNRDNNKLDIRTRTSRTQPLAEAAEDLQYIRSVLRGEKQPSLVGTVGQMTADVKTNLLDKPRFGSNLLGLIFYGKPAPGIKVFAEGKEQTYETLSDATGFYQFFDLPDGKYKIRADFPPYFSLKEVETEVKTTNRSCALGYLGANRKGLIIGKIFDANGNPIKGVYVSLIPADAAQSEIFTEKYDDYSFPWAVSVTLENGEYGFAALPAGNYYIVINRAERERKYGSEAAQKLPRLFYPGVQNLEKAAVISLKEGEQLKGKDFQLQKINQ